MLCTTALVVSAPGYCNAQRLLTPCAQEYNGALIAITHNPAFARSLEATHVLRVRDGQVSLAANYGLMAADFDHTAPPVPVARAASAEQAAGSSGADKPRKVCSIYHLLAGSSRMMSIEI